MTDSEDDINQQAAAFDQMNKFDQMHGASDSSDDDRRQQYGGVLPKQATTTTASESLAQKNQILMERLIKAERKNEELKSTIEAVSGNQDNLKDRKIIDLAKKNRKLQM